MAMHIIHIAYSIYNIHTDSGKCDIMYCYYATDVCVYAYIQCHIMFCITMSSNLNSIHILIRTKCVILLLLLLSLLLLLLLLYIYVVYCVYIYIYVRKQKM